MSVPILDLRTHCALHAPQEEIIRLMGNLAATPEDAAEFLGINDYDRKRDLALAIAKIRVVWADALIKALNNE